MDPTLNPKPCSKCKEIKKIEDFNLSNGKCSRYCKVCARAAAKENYELNRHNHIIKVKKNQMKFVPLK